MPRFRSRGGFRRRRSYGRMIQRARPIIRAASGITLTKRFIFSGLTIPDVTAADFDNELDTDLVVCQESVDEELESDGTNVAQVPLYSRLTAIRANIQLVATSNIIFRWLLYKKPDGESLVTDLTNSGQWHSSNDTPTLREIRKYTVAKGMIINDAAGGVSKLRIFVSRQAMRRISPMRENDRLSLVIAKDATGTTAAMHGFGTLYFKANA